MENEANKLKLDLSIQAAKAKGFNITPDGKFYLSESEEATKFLEIGVVNRSARFVFGRINQAEWVLVDTQESLPLGPLVRPHLALAGNFVSFPRYSPETVIRVQTLDRGKIKNWTLDLNHGD